MAVGSYVLPPSFHYIDNPLCFHRIVMGSVQTLYSILDWSAMADQAHPASSSLEVDALTKIRRFSLLTRVSMVFFLLSIGLVFVSFFEMNSLLPKYYVYPLHDKFMLSKAVAPGAN